MRFMAGSFSSDRAFVPAIAGMRLSVRGIHCSKRDTRRAMSQENVELVRRFGLSEPDDGSDAHPDIVWNPVDEEASQGHDAVRASQARWDGRVG
jgi:hypothetical protein